ncbi:MAG TPA: hypothetical protein VFT36_03230 [Methylomirabilota bacterium]|nr:hypothetical protein [Methylomirabilota bacterium]
MRRVKWEAETLADPRLPGLLRQQGICLIGYHELGEAIALLDRGRG